MMKRSWNREKIATALYDLHERGIPLNVTDIQKEDNGITNAIFYKKNGNYLYFGSIKSAREEAAKYATSVGHLESAAAIRAYNEGRRAPNRLANEKEEQKKKELITELKRKVEAGEDVSYRYLQKYDGSFVHRCVREFGTYKRCFEEAGITQNS